MAVSISTIFCDLEGQIRKSVRGFLEAGIKIAGIPHAGDAYRSDLRSVYGRILIIFDHCGFLSSPTKSLNKHSGLSGSMLSNLEELGAGGLRSSGERGFYRCTARARVLLKTDELFALWCTIVEVTPTLTVELSARYRIEKTGMKNLPSTFMLLWLFASAAAHTQTGTTAASAAPVAASAQNPPTITITRSGSQPSRQAPGEHMTGSVRIEPLFSEHDPSRVSGGKVTFEPGARTAWCPSG
jgi:hypothetical protein